MSFITPRIAFILVLMTSFIWGVEFVLVDIAINTLPTHTFNAVRFAIASLSLLPLLFLSKEKLAPKQLKPLIFSSLLLGLLLFIAFYTQTEGMRYTSVSNAGFITGLCVPLVSLLGVIFFKQASIWSVWIGVTLATAGLYFLTIGDAFVFNKGDVLVLICAFSFALHILLTGRFVKTIPVMHISMAQLLAVTLYSSIASALSNHPSFYVQTPTQWFEPFIQPIIVFAILIAGILGTAFAYWSQSVSQTLLAPHKVALIFASEPIFAHLSAWYFLNEHLGWLGLMGGLMIILGMVISELGDKQHPPKINVLDQNSSA